ncbi:alpha/beta fold hydrolase [Miltoncostaea oceani]|uniref:alpha/beta fold hydrolase n=1 Tax=Miltoncostaea oceani TaxID=2843216 RepID=UPI001C3D77F2|nr:alpha/beta fold hydrolase [Miltoncostaea oceani]
MAGEAHPRALGTWTAAGGVRVHARLLRPAGRSAGPVVMVHGLGVSAGSLGPLAEELARDHVVLVCDLPGFGRTDSDAIWSTGAAADVLEEVLALRGMGRVTLVGHSWGCHVATVLAARHPGRVRALVLLSPAFDGRGGAAGQVVRLAVDSPMERPSLVAGGARDYLRAGLPRVLATLREASALPLDELVVAVRAPVLVVRGSRDPLTTGRWARRIAVRARRARIVVIPRAAHGLGHDAPRAAAGAIRAFLAGEGHRPRMAAPGGRRPAGDGA